MPFRPREIVGQENSEVADNLKNAYDEAVEWAPDDFKVGGMAEVRRQHC